MHSIKVGTRKSDLAKTQTRQVIQTLAEKGFSAEESFVITKGDIDYRPLNQLAGDGFFTKEIEKELLEKKIQLAVHSSKDLPSMIHQELPWVAYGEREDTQDVLIFSKNLKGLPKKVGTSSPRRRAQFSQYYPEIELVELRGNVPTRINKVISGELEGVVLAKAGINRLKLFDYIESNNLQVFELPFTTAPCQGILGVQGSLEHSYVLERIMNSKLTEIARAEKSMLALFGGGCHLTLGTHISETNDKFNLKFFLKDEETHNFEVTANRLGDVVRNAYSKTFRKSWKSRVWLTQPLQHQHSVAKKLAEFNIEPVSWPLIEVKPTWNYPDLNINLNDFGSIAFTSQFGAHFFLMEWALRSDENLNALKNSKVFAIGKATAQILKNVGIEATIPLESHGEALLKVLPDSSKPILIPGTLQTRLGKILDESKKPYKIINLYQSFPASWALRTDVPVVKDGDKIVLTSPSAVEQFVVECQSNRELKQLQVFSIGPTTAKALEKNGIESNSANESGNWDNLVSLLK